MSRTERVINFVTSQPGVWINAVAFERVGGRQGWRTRVSEARKQLEAQKLGTIENRVRRAPGGWKASEYRFVPRDLFSQAS